ncbi:hypothetical protein [Bacillus sp. 1P06AnD]|uniref:hypothetical protein n=1 Tax=Bacillus sp. 1P06AnD TaxID=3132208 RepID=UPI0039A2CF55
MNETRKKIILNEIQYWKKTKMLPETYCDFLMTLYLEGGAETSPPRSRSVFSPINYLTAGLLISVLIVNYFTEFPGVMQMAIYLLCISLIIWILYYGRNKKDVKIISLLALAFTAVIGTVNLWKGMLPGHYLVLYCGLLANCAMWMFVGLKLKMIYFTVAGGLGSIVILYFVCAYFKLI